MVDFNEDSLNYLMGLQQGARLKAMGGLDPEEKLDPEAAAQALELSKATGADPSLIRQDLPAFKQRNRNFLVDQILVNNPRLQDYVHSHPLAAEVSANDWHVLDSLDEKFLNFAKGTKPVAQQALEGFLSAFEGPPGAYMKPPQYKAGDILPPVTDPAAIIAPIVATAGVPLELAFRLPGGVIAGGVQGAVEAIKQATGQDYSEVGEDILRVISDPGTWASIGFPDPLIGMSKILEANRELRREVQKAIPFIAAKVEPPWQGSEPLTKAKKALSKADSAAIEELLKGSEESETRQIAPEIFRDHFVVPRAEDSKVGIDADAALALYGPDETPTPGDGKLGFIPNIAEQWERAKNTGHDIDVPLENWTAEVPKEVAKALQDHVRPRAGDMTPDEIKKLGEKEVEAAKVEEPEAPNTVRFYHGGHDPTSGGPRWLTPDPEYARRFRAGETDNEVHYVDIPKGHPTEVAARMWDEMDEKAGTTMVGRYGNIEAPEEIAKQLKPLPIEAPPSLINTLRESSGLAPMATARPRPALPPEGVIPEGSLLGQTINQQGHEAAAVGSFSLRDGLAKIKTDRLDDFHAALNEHFTERLSTLVGDTKVHILEDEDFESLGQKLGLENPKGFDGWFDSTTNDIIARKSAIDGNPEYGGHQGAAGLLLHEGAHALTWHAMRDRPELGEIFDDMRKELINHLDKIGDAETKKEIEYYLQNFDEFVAGGYDSKAFREALATAPVSPELAERVGLAKGQPHTLWDAFRQKISDIFYWLLNRRLDNTMLDAFLKMQERFEKPTFEDLFPSGIAGAPTRREPIPDYLQQAFKTGQALKMNNARLRAYLEKVAEQHAGDVEFSKDQAILEAGKEATEDWKENLPRVREETRKAIYARPDIALDRYLREAKYPNNSSGPKVKIAREFIPPEYRGKIPEEFIAKKGLHPDALAEIFDLQSGRQVLENLASLEEQRQQEGLTPAAHLTQTIAAETQRQMTKDYGRTPEEILEDAQDHIFKPTTHDIIHDELAATYEMLGQKPITKEAMKADSQKLFDLLPADLHSSKKYTDALQKKREEAIDHLLADNPAESLKAQEKAAKLAHHADMALKLEKQLAWLDKKFKTSWGRRDPPGMDQEHTVWLHDILRKVGYEPKRIEGDLERQKELSSPFKTLREYVQYISDTRSQEPDAMFPGQFPVAWWLTGDNFFQPLKTMTPPEIADVITSLKAIDALARSERTETKAGEKVATGKVIEGLIDRLKAAVDQKEVSQRFFPTVGRTIGANLLNVESWMTRLDLGNAFGPFNQLIVRPIMEGLYKEADLQREFAKLWKELPGLGKREKIENPNIFMELDENKKPTNTAIPLDTVNLRAIIQNMGNAEQRKTLALGYGTTEEKIWDWLFNVVKITKEDFKAAQQMGDIFEKAFKFVEEADERRYGVAPERIPLGEIQTPWGMEREWYHPKIPDSLRHSGQLTKEEMMDQSGYYRPAPASGFKQRRTGAVYPIDLTFDQVPLKLKQILKYATMGEPVAEVSKIALDPRFQTAFKRFYGQEYADGLKKWLQDVAGNEEWKPKGERQLEAGLRFLQENMAHAQIAWNLGTVVKHGPTALGFSIMENPAAFAKSAIEMIKEVPSGNRAWREAFGKSAEIRSRFRFMSENISATNQEVFNKFDWNYKYFSMREMVQLAGHFPVAVSDLLSSVTMWNGIYKQSLAEGMAEGDAIYAANTAVRRTHGSMIIGAKAGIMRPTSPMARSFLQYYNFFSVALQRNYQLGWMAKLAAEGRELPEMTGFEKEQYDKGFKHLPYILGGVLVYGALVSLWEQVADPLERGEDENPFHYWGKVLVRSYPAQVPYVREVFSGLYHATTGTAGMMGSMMRTAYDELNPNLWFSNPGKIVRKTNAVLALFSGMTADEWGKISQYVLDTLDEREEPPEGPVDLYNIYRHGKLKKQPRSATELIEQITGVPRSER